MKINTLDQQEIISHGILNLFFFLLIAKVILIGGNSNNTEVYKVTHSMPSIPFPRVLTHDWVISEECNTATFSEPHLTTKRKLEFPWPDIAWKSCFQKRQRGPGAPVAYKWEKQAAGALWPWARLLHRILDKASVCRRYRHFKREGEYPFLLFGYFIQETWANLLIKRPQSSSVFKS